MIKPATKRRARWIAAAFTAASATLVTAESAQAQLGKATSADKPNPTPQRGLNETEIAKSFQNPVGDLISIPIPMTFDFSDGPSSRTSYAVSVNPFVPVNLTKDLRLISRGFIPMLDRPERTTERATGLGDITLSFYFAPNVDRKFNWGVGPMTVLPTATSIDTGSGKLSIGPTAAVVFTEGPFVVGGVASQVWSVSGKDTRDNVSLLTLTPLAYYNFWRGWSVGSTPNVLVNFSESGSNMWTLPLGGGLYKVIRADHNASLSFSVQAYGNVIRPDNGPDAQVRLVVAGLFPQ